MFFHYKKSYIVCNENFKNTPSIRRYGTVIKQPKNITVIPDYIWNFVKSSLLMKQSTFYLGLIATNLNYVKPKNIIETSTSVNYFRNPLKNNIECGTTGNISKFTNKGLQKNKTLTLHEKQKVSDTSFINYIWNNALPGTPTYRIYVLERLNIIVQYKRWQILQYLHDNSDLNSKDILNSLVVENIEANADANFIIEVRAAFCFSVPFFQGQNNGIIFQELRLIHATIENSEERLLSIQHCGQSNCDLLFKYKINNMPHIVTLPLDIKHRVLVDSDFAYNRLKVFYNENHIPEFNTYSCKNEQLYINNIIKNLQVMQEEEAIEFVTYLKNSLSNNTKMSDIIFKIQEFILLHPQQQYAKMSILLTEQTSISEEHFYNMSQISPEHASKITEKTFTKGNYKSILDDFTNDSLNKPFVANLKKNLFNESVNTIQSWKFSTPKATDLPEISHD